MNKLPQIILLAIMLTVSFCSNHALSNGNDRVTTVENKRDVTARPKPKTRDRTLPPATNTPSRLPKATINPIHSKAPEATTNATLRPTGKSTAKPTADMEPTVPSSSHNENTNNNSATPTTLVDAAGAPITLTDTASESVQTTETSRIISEPIKETPEPIRTSNSVSAPNVNTQSSASTARVLEIHNSTNSSLTQIKDPVESNENSDPVNNRFSGASELNLQINTNIDPQPNTQLNTQIKQVTKTGTPINSIPVPSLASGSLIGSSLPSSIRLPNYPKINYDSTFYVANQLIIISLDMPQAKKIAVLMRQYQARVIRRAKLKNLNFVLSTFRLPKQISVKHVIEEIRNVHPKILIEPNHYFFPQSNPSTRELNNRYEVFNKINKPIDHLCGENLRIGMLDGPIETSHISLKNQNIIQKSFYAKSEKLAPHNHATAIASLLIGDPKVKGLAGLISKATLYSGNVMQQHPKNKRKMLATTESIILGLNWLTSKQVHVINLSLGGKPNLLLAVALKKVIDKKIVVVASAGNDGPKADPSYPAAMANVIAVTSIDHNEQIASDANQGSYIDIAAPGVELWVAGKNNSGRYTSGTSIAAPLVTAAVALLVQKKQSINMLFEQAIDLGSSGKDSVFGHGLLQFSNCGE